MVVAEAGGADEGLFLGMGGAEDVVGQFGGHDVGQMAGTAHEVVVGLGGHAAGAGADVAPESFDGGDAGGRGAGAGGDEANGVVKQIRPGGGQAAFFGAGHGVAADEFDAGVAKEGFQFEGDGAFDAADIGDDGAGLQMEAHLGGDLAHLGQGSAEDDEIGALHGVLEIARDEIGHARARASAMLAARRT